MHVRGYTRHPSSKVKNPGTFAGIIEKIPYLRELGITAVELLPVTEFNENDWLLTIKNNMEVEGMLKKHIAIMDKYDPENEIALLADEWGNWHE